MTTDTIADMLTRIRNANLAKHQIVQIPSTKITKNVAQVLFTEGLIDSFEELKNMVVIQKIPKDLVIVSDFIVDRNEARLRKQPPSGFNAYCLKTSLEDSTHNSIQPGDRINIVGVFKVKDESGDDLKLVTTFLKNIEVWQNPKCQM